MESLYILVPVSLVFVFVIGWVFWRALEGGQFDDLERPGFDVLNDDDRGQTPVDKSATVLDQPSTKNDLSTGV
jgi:cbb3-type cytochrome oxidase maturation protein